MASTTTLREGHVDSDASVRSRKRKSSKERREEFHKDKKKKKESSDSRSSHSKKKKKSKRESPVAQQQASSSPSAPDNTLRVRSVSELARLISQGSVQLPRSLVDFANDRVLLLDQVFTILSAGEIEEMLPDILKGLEMKNIKQLCYEQLKAMTPDDIRDALEPREPKLQDDEEEEERKDTALVTTAPKVVLPSQDVGVAKVGEEEEEEEEGVESRPREELSLTDGSHHEVEEKKTDVGKEKGEVARGKGRRKKVDKSESVESEESGAVGDRDQKRNKPTRLHDDEGAVNPHGRKRDEHVVTKESGVFKREKERDNLRQSTSGSEPEKASKKKSIPREALDSTARLLHARMLNLEVPEASDGDNNTEDMIEVNAGIPGDEIDQELTAQGSSVQESAESIEDSTSVESPYTAATVQPEEGSVSVHEVAESAQLLEIELRKRALESDLRRTKMEEKARKAQEEASKLLEAKKKEAVCHVTGELQERTAEMELYEARLRQRALLSLLAKKN